MLFVLESVVTMSSRSPGVLREVAWLSGVRSDRYCAGVAQLAAHPTCNRAVPGSSPGVGSRQNSDQTGPEGPRRDTGCGAKQQLRCHGSPAWSMSVVSWCHRDAPARRLSELTWCDLSTAQGHGVWGLCLRARLGCLRAVRRLPRVLRSWRAEPTCEPSLGPWPVFGQCPFRVRLSGGGRPGATWVRVRVRHGAIFDNGATRGALSRCVRSLGVPGLIGIAAPAPPGAPVRVTSRHVGDSLDQVRILGYLSTVDDQRISKMPI